MSERGGIGRRTLLAGSAIAAVMVKSPAAARSPSPAAANFDTWSRINALLQACADCLDRCDAEGFGAIFTVDGVFDYKPGTIIRGRAALVGAAARAFAQVARSSHHVGPPVVTSGDATGRWLATSRFSAHHLLADGTRFALHGHYEDRLETEAADGNLRLAYRKVIGHIGDGQSDREDRYWLRPL